MKYVFIITIAILATACTVSFSNINTKGTAGDVGDNKQTTDPDITTTAPLK